MPYVWLRQIGSIWLLISATVSLIIFSWLLTLHPVASGRIYAAYGGVYVSIAILWLWMVDGIRSSITDLIGCILCLSGMVIIMVDAKS